MRRDGGLSSSYSSSGICVGVVGHGQFALLVMLVARTANREHQNGKRVQILTKINGTQKQSKCEC
jgi:hypothetical protein